MTGLGLIGGASSRGLVTSELSRGVGLAVGLAVGIRFLDEGAARGGRGTILGAVGLVIGPTITLGGTILGAGAGM
jgi:hypothetical protein